MERVNSWKEQMSEDDTVYVIRYAALWLETGKVAMQNIADQKAVQLQDSEKVKTLAAATLGHLLELTMEAKGRNRDRVFREVEEYVETAQEFLSLPTLKQYRK